MPTPSSHIKRAQEHAARKDWDKAISEYEALLERDAAQNPSLYNLIGDLYAKKDDLEHAFQNYEKAIEIYCEETLYNNAIALCKKCLRVDSGRVEIYNRLGGLYASQGLVQEAIQHLSDYAARKKAVRDVQAVTTTWRRVLEIAPDNPQLRSDYVEALLDLDQAGEAAREIHELSRLWRERGDEKQANAAESRATEILESLPAGADVGANAPDAPVFESPLETASGPGGAGAAGDPAGDGLLEMNWDSVDLPETAAASAAQAGGGVGAPEAELPQADPVQGEAKLFDLGADTGDAEAAGQLDIESARPGAADLDIEPARSGAADGADSPGASERGPDGVPTDEARGNVSVRERAQQEDDLIDLNDVLDEFRSGVSQVIESEDYQSHYDLGMSYKEMELFDDAIAAFQAATQSDDLRLPATEMIGECLLAKGDTEQAITHLLDVLDTDGGSPKSIGLRYTLGNAYLRQNDRSRASECYEAIVAVDPQFRDAAQRLEHLQEKPA